MIAVWNATIETKMSVPIMITHSFTNLVFGIGAIIGPRGHPPGAPSCIGIGTCTDTLSSAGAPSMGEIKSSLPRPSVP